MAAETSENVGSTIAATAATEEVSSMAAAAVVSEEKKSIEAAKKKRGIISRMWNRLFGSRKDDFERRLERITKEEATVLRRMSRRAVSWSSWKRHIILFSLLLEVAAVCYAIVTARTAQNWKIRALRVLPMFLLPALSSLTYSGLSSFISMCEKKDQKTLEKLRTERQSKIDELKERTNYYITQQLIQRYDTDPAAKAAAASVLASKLGADSGLKVSLGDDSAHNALTGKSNDVQLAQSDGLRNRRQPQARATSPGGTVIQHSAGASPHAQSEYAEYNQQQLVDHYQGQGDNSFNSGWLSRIAALFVGEDPSQCYALICGNCHTHNGLASKEDFRYVTYICPHCHAVNGPKIQQEHASSTTTPNMGSTVTLDPGNASSSIVDSPHDSLVDSGKTEAAPVVTEGSEIANIPEVPASDDES